MCCILFNKSGIQKTYLTIYVMGWTIILNFVQYVQTSLTNFSMFFFGFYGLLSHLA